MFHAIALLACLTCQSLAFRIAHSWPTTRQTKLQPTHAAIKTDIRPNQDDTGFTSGITDWVVENLEVSGNSITSTSATMAGENDILPSCGLPIGPFRIIASGISICDSVKHEDGLLPIRLLVGRNGWGTGVHPTTRLCLEWLSHADTLRGGEIVLDYGCGSGILSIAALHIGAARSIGVDVEAEALVTAERNAQLNNFGDRFEPLHTREILPYGISPSADVCIANILIGQLVRPSMVAAILSNLAAGGMLCLSGIRPGQQVESLRKAYGDSVDWIGYEELAARNTIGSIESYGFDCGTWCCLIGRKRCRSRADEIAKMSELAVS